MKFIEIIWINRFGGGLFKQDYIFMPVRIMSEKGYESKILNTSPYKKIYPIKSYFDEGTVDEKIKIIHKRGIFSYFLFLFKNKDSIIFANDRTGKSLLSSFFGKRTIFMSHQSNIPEKSWKRFVLKIFIPRFDAIKVASQYEKKGLMLLGVKEHKIKIIPIPIDYEFFNKNMSEKSLSETRKKYGLLKKEKVILFIGSIRDFKRPDVAIKALSLLKKTFAFKLVMVGDDKLQQQNLLSCLQQAKNLGIEKKLVMTGRIDSLELRNLMAISDVFLNTSEHEGQCISATEAAAFGLPLFLSRIGSFTSVYKTNAIYHSVEDYRTLAKNLKQFFKDKRLFSEEMLKNNKKLIKEKYDYELVKSQMIDLFEGN